MPGLSQGNVTNSGGLPVPSISRREGKGKISSESRDASERTRMTISVFG
jgi:hypothetical protein